jgi:uncharacterized repeat protein (TIGR03803 family)
MRLWSRSFVFLLAVLTATRVSAQVAGDFNGDGKSDILWRQSTTGQVGIWLMDGFVPFDSRPISAENPNWRVVGIADFDGDGRADILWHQPTTGENSIWLMNGLTMTDGHAIPATAPSWMVVGVGDFDRDGRADILWRDSATGVAAVWLMAGFVPKAAAVISAPYPTWDIVGCADFNGDGSADILWRHTITGQVGIWLMNGFMPIDTAPISAENPSWRIAAVADFDGDGRADILWHQPATGANSIWLMNGLQLLDGRAIFSTTDDWVIVSAADFNGDGRAEILDRQTSTGVNVLWQMSGFSLSAARTVSAPYPMWNIVGTGIPHASLPFEVVHTFSVSTPPGPARAALLQARDGYFYGTTYRDNGNEGAVFRMDVAGNVVVLHTFTGPDGANSDAALIQATDGYLYGTTTQGGAFNRGTVFRMTPTGDVTTVHSFTGGADGELPAGALVQANDGNFYGLCGPGTIFRLAPDGTYAVLFQFGSVVVNASHPGTPALVQATDGNLYGVTEGIFDRGSVFRMTLGGELTVLHQFTGSPDGSHPHGALIQAADGAFYGTTLDGGAWDAGTIFRMTADGVVTVLHSFDSGQEGWRSAATLLQGTDNAFYGVAQNGGAKSCGTVFRMTPDGDVATLHDFNCTEGSAPYSELIRGADGNLYGVTPFAIAYRIWR